MYLDDLALPKKVVLPNGVPLYIIEGGTQDVVRLDLLFKGGYGVQEKPLQALFTNRMLREGTSDFSAEEISHKLDFYGAWIEMYSSQNCNHITLYTLGRHLEPLLGVLESMVKRPLFPQNKLDTVRSSNKAHFGISCHKVGNVAQRHFEQMLWGCNHPLGHIVCADDYDAIDRELLQKYHRTFYGSSGMTLFLSGKIDEKNLAGIESHFGIEHWGACVSFGFNLPDEPEPVFGRRKVDMPSVLQGGVKIGCMVMNSGDSDFLKFRFLTVLFGGYFGSRLMSNIRERNGYTYHIEADLDAYGCRNALTVSSQAAVEFVEPLIKEVYAEMESLRQTSVTAEELELVRNYTLGELCREYEGVLPKAEVFINMWLSGEPFETVNEYLQVVRTVSANELKQLACKYLLPERMSEVVVAP